MNRQMKHLPPDSSYRVVSRCRSSAPDDMLVRIRRSPMPAASMLIALALGQHRRDGPALTLRWRVPVPCAFSLPTSAGCLEFQTNRHLVMVVVRPAPPTRNRGRPARGSTAASRWLGVAFVVSIFWVINFACGCGAAA
jgi:hypothetical protein